MKKRIILYKKGFRYELALEEGKTATVSNQETAQLTISSQENPPSFSKWSKEKSSTSMVKTRACLKIARSLGMWSATWRQEKSIPMNC